MIPKEHAYPFHAIEPKWQKYWLHHKTFAAKDPGQPGSEKPKYYVLDMFPYPSASGLHVGHLEGYTATDILARYKRMVGFNVLHPMGWDAFGLPAEQHAIETKSHPRIVTKRNVENFKRQIQSIGFSYDWDREINTTDPDYYRWTQWIFLKLYEKGLAYEAEAPVNWCPALGTVLANEEVIDGKSERGGHPVIRRPMRQWMLKITAYAERLLEDLESLDWPESIKEMQRNWIGKSIGAEVDFPVLNSKEVIRIFTTRPDTLFGATYMVLAPENPLVGRVASEEARRKVTAYQDQAARKSDLQRTDLSKEKTGVFTGGYAINPVNQEKIPIWIADYVLMGYGTGAIMAVPAHDERDFEFAKTFSLPIKRVVAEVTGRMLSLNEGNTSQAILDAARNEYERLSREGAASPVTAAFVENGIAVNSTAFDGSFTINELPTELAKQKITEWLEMKGIGKRTVNYRLRDWLFSRQRYWGEPFPIIHLKGASKPLPLDVLPVTLPDVESYEPTGSGESPLAAIASWLETQDPETGLPAQRETNTMPQWAGSCWYYLRYIDAKNPNALVHPEKERYWMNVDMYIGGAEHAVLHLLYARFWHKVLYDCGVVSTKEPFQRLVNQGMILGEDNQKMSKSRGNVMNPDDIVKEYGADCLRMYEMFMGPLEMAKPWSTNGLQGVSRFLNRVWRLFIDEQDAVDAAIRDVDPSETELKIMHKTIKKVTDDVESLKFHTAISALMVFVNEMMKVQVRSKRMMEHFVLLLSPFAPHLAEELWQRFGHAETIAYERWPSYEERYLAETETEIVLQVSGKIRSRMMVSKGLNENEMKEKALSDENIKKWVEGKQIKKIITVADRLVNIIV